MKNVLSQIREKWKLQQEKIKKMEEIIGENNTFLKKSHKLKYNNSNSNKKEKNDSVLKNENRLIELERQKKTLKKNNLQLRVRWEKSFKCLKSIQICLRKHGIIGKKQTLMRISEHDLFFMLKKNYLCKENSNP